MNNVISVSIRVLYHMAVLIPIESCPQQRCEHSFCCYVIKQAMRSYVKFICSCVAGRQSSHNMECMLYACMDLLS